MTAPAQKVLKARLDGARSNLRKVSLPTAGWWNETGFKVPSQRKLCCYSALEAAIVCLQNIL